MPRQEEPDAAVARTAKVVEFGAMAVGSSPLDASRDCAEWRAASVGDDGFRPPVSRGARDRRIRALIAKAWSEASMVLLRETRPVAANV